MFSGYHAVYEDDYFSAIDTAVRSGFDFVQFDLNVPRYFLDRLTDSQLAEIKAYAECNQIKISFHAPCDNVSLFCDYPEIRRGILSQYERILEKATVLNAHHLTIHAGAMPHFKRAGENYDAFSNSYKEYYQGILYENIKNIAQYSGCVIVSVENSKLDEISMNAVKKLLDEGYVSLTLDIAKLFTPEIEPDKAVTDFMFSHADQICELHIHDFHPKLGQHQAIGSGEIDFQPYFELMTRKNTFLNFEIRPAAAAAESRDKLFKALNTYRKIAKPEE